MKRAWIFLAAALLAVSACSEGDDGTKPGSFDRSEYAGTFYVRYTIVETTCSIAPPLDGNATIEIEGDTIVWGSMSGPWDEETRHGSGASAAPTCIPINPSTGCVGCFTTSFDIVYASADSFSGVFRTYYSYSEACGADSCHTYYSISGVR